jgi:hypothetical protein
MQAIINLREAFSQEALERYAKISNQPAMHFVMCSPFFSRVSIARTDDQLAAVFMYCFRVCEQIYFVLTHVSCFLFPIRYETRPRVEDL